MIAISYRREDSLPIAGRLYDRLQVEFGRENVFMDFDSIPPGVDFRERIKGTIERSDVIVALIGPLWLGEQSDGSRRIDDPTDFVRLEIEYALKSGTPVIPLLINSTPMPKPEKLPPDIQALAFRNALPLDSGLDFHQHTDRLIMGISQGAAQITGAAKRSYTPDRPPASRRQSNFAIWAILIALTGAAAGIWQFVFRAGSNSSATATHTSTTKADHKEAAQASPTAQESPPSTHSAFPAGYLLVPDSISPNGRFGVTAPDKDHFIDGAFQSEVIDIDISQRVGVIRAVTSPLQGMNRRHINPSRWSQDSSVLLWEIEGRWSPDALVLLKIGSDGRTIEWQKDILKTVQDEMLTRTKQAASELYAKAKEMNQGSGSTFPDGFVVNVRVRWAGAKPIVFPMPISAKLTSNPKQIEPAKIAADLNSELQGYIGDDGKIAVTEFSLTKKSGWEITGSDADLATPSVSEAPPPVLKSAPGSKVGRLFVGTWQGKVSYESRVNGKPYQNIQDWGLIIDEHGGVVTAPFRDGKPTVPDFVLQFKTPWTQVNSRTLSSNDLTSSLAVNDDGKTAVYSSQRSSGADGVEVTESWHGVLHKKR